ncbi:cytochrome P450 [Streptomyces sp. NBC_01116]|uniref:cytochrome P450 n=1 Tax=Streptomyces sp. NBC_01116 TaxID=2903752 RepID=UPI00324D4D68
MAVQKGASLPVPWAFGKRALLRNLLLFGHDVLSACDEVRDSGPVVKVVVGSGIHYVVNDGALVREILIDRGGAFSRQRESEALRATIGDVLFTLDGEAHRRRRRVMHPSFSMAAVRSDDAAVATLVDGFTDRWRSGERIDLHAEMRRLSVEVTLRVLLRCPVDETIAVSLAADIPILTQSIAARSAASGWRRATHGSHRHRSARRAAQRVHATVGSLLELRGALEGSDVVSRMRTTAAFVDGPPVLSSVQVVEEVVNFLVAGTEPTATILTWALHELSQNPRTERAVQQEADSVLSGGRLAPGLGSQLQTAFGVVKETLRCYPPPTLPREVGRDAVIGGYWFPAGTRILLNLHALHHDPERYQHPTMFDETRWLHGEALRAGPDAYLPFGAGAHRCVGASFAEMIAAVSLAAISRRYVLRTCQSGGPVDAESSSMTVPQGLMVIPLPRINGNKASGG